MDKTSPAWRARLPRRIENIHLMIGSGKRRTLAVSASCALEGARGSAPHHCGKTLGITVPVVKLGVLFDVAVRLSSKINTDRKSQDETRKPIVSHDEVSPASIRNCFGITDGDVTPTKKSPPTLRVNSFTPSACSAFFSSGACGHRIGTLSIVPSKVIRLPARTRRESASFRTTSSVRFGMRARACWRHDRLLILWGCRNGEIGRLMHSGKSAT